MVIVSAQQYGTNKVMYTACFFKLLINKIGPLYSVQCTLTQTCNLLSMSIVLTYFCDYFVLQTNHTTDKHTLNIL